MIVRRFVSTSALLLAVLGAPRTSEAGLFDFIWEMSGPQMIGAGYGCLFTPPPKVEKKGCRIGGVAGYAALLENEKQRLENQQPGKEQRKENRIFFALNGAYYLSTDKDSGENQENHYDWQDAQMLAFSPALLVRSIRSTPPNQPFEIYHGAGVSYNFLFGRHFKRFDKFALTFTPIDVSYKRVSVGFTARLYPNGFTADEFGIGPRVTFDRKREWVWGFNVGWALPECPCPKK